MIGVLLLLFLLTAREDGLWTEQSLQGRNSEAGRFAWHKRRAPECALPRVPPDVAPPQTG
jgi:hypothetical protein